jgi:NAD(P)-dependent dehydrogenase (short-subunit alcohol dehydrogenase family)
VNTFSFLGRAHEVSLSYMYSFNRDQSKLAPLAEAIGATPFAVDCNDIESIVSLFNTVDTTYGQSAEVVLYNTGGGFGAGGPCGTIPYKAMTDSLQIGAGGAFVAGHEAGKRMIPHGKGAIFFTGATASVKAFPESSVFAMSCFAKRALAQSLYKELSPLGIHVAHFVIDGGVGWSPGFSAECIAQSYMAVLNQPKGAWSWELELRCNVEKF